MKIFKNLTIFVQWLMLICCHLTVSQAKFRSKISMKSFNIAKNKSIYLTKYCEQLRYCINTRKKKGEQKEQKSNKAKID